MKVTIAIPSYDSWRPEFGLSLSRLLLAPPYQTEIEVHAVISTYLPQARQMLAKQVVKSGSDKTLWLDSDMEFPANTLKRLLEDNKEIVGANYRARRPPHRFVAGWGHEAECITSSNSKGLIQVDSIGFGVLLTDTGLLDTEEPLFSTPWISTPVGPQIMGEDIWFCRNMLKTGHKIYVDHDLSKDVKHIGLYPYSISE
jgi:hypothetical protein